MTTEEDQDPGSTIVSSSRGDTSTGAGHYLTVVRGPVRQRSVAVGHEPFTLGRDRSRSFYLPDAEVSRAHCEVRLVGKELVVRDLGSTNGTRVDGKLVTDAAPLPLLSVLHLGRHILRHELLTPDEAERREEHARELDRARQYVEALIPAPLDEGPVRVDWCFEPSAGLGGDALGYHALDGDRFAFYVVDVCGHGVSSAMHSASVLNSLRSHTLPDTDFGSPAQVLERLNAAFAMDDHDGMYFSMWYGVLHHAARRLVYSSAGHPPAIVRGPNGGIARRLGCKNPPIGVIGGRAFTEQATAFEPGERLYAYSDGVYEIVDRHGRDRSLGDFEAVLTTTQYSTRGEPRRIYDAAREAAGTEILDDDFTLLLVTHDPNAGA